MAAESRFAEVSDEYLRSLLHKSIPKLAKKSTKYRMKIFNGWNSQSKFELLANVAVNFDSFCNFYFYRLFDKLRPHGLLTQSPFGLEE